MLFLCPLPRPATSRPLTSAGGQNGESSYTTRKWSKRQKVHPLGGFFGMSGVRRGPFLPRKASPRPMSPRHRWPVAVTACRSLAPFSHSLLCGVSLRKKATLWPFHLLTPAPSQKILKRGFGHSREVGCSFFAHFRDRPPRGRSLPRAVKTGKTIHNPEAEQTPKVHPLGGFFCFSTKMPLNQTSPEGAGWDEELSNIGS